MVHRAVMSLSPSKEAPWDLTQFSQSPSADPSCFPESHWQSEISSLSKVILVLGKPKVTARQVWSVGGGGTESPGWFDVSPKNSARDVMCKRVHCCDKAASHQLPIAVALTHPKGFHGGMFKLNEICNADSLLYSLSHCECGSHTVHMLTQQHLPTPLTNTVKSSLFTHVHSSLLSLAARSHRCCTNHFHYINNGWTFSRQTSLYTMVVPYL